MQRVQEHWRRQTSLYECEYRIRHKDGHYCWMFARGQAQWDPTGTVVRMLACYNGLCQCFAATKSCWKLSNQAAARPPVVPRKLTLTALRQDARGLHARKMASISRLAPPVNNQQLLPQGGRGRELEKH